MAWQGKKRIFITENRKYQLTLKYIPTNSVLTPNININLQILSEIALLFILLSIKTYVVKIELMIWVQMLNESVWIYFTLMPLEKA